MESTTDDTDLSSSETSNRPQFYKCPIEDCKAKFKKQSKLLFHIRIHTGERPFVCNVEGCNKSYTNSSHLRRHKTSAHATNPRIKCTHPGCEMDFSNNTNLKKHIARKHDENRKYRFKCSICDKGFFKKVFLQKHLYEHTGVKSFECTLCPLKFGISTDLKRHMRSHKTYTCECGEEFNRYREILKHRKEKHKTEIQCEECGKTFGSKSNLNKHKQKIHVSIEDMNIYSCPWEGCERTYMYKRNLRVHIRQFHQKIVNRKQFPCPVEGCNVTLSRRQTLKFHIESHTKSKPNNPTRAQYKHTGVPQKSLKADLAGIKLTQEENQKLLTDELLDVDNLQSKESSNPKKEDITENPVGIIVQWELSSTNEDSEMDADFELVLSEPENEAGSELDNVKVNSDSKSMEKEEISVVE